MSNSVSIPLPDWLASDREATPALASSAEQMAFIVGLAKKNVGSGGGPFAAGIFGADGALVAAGLNRVVAASAPIAHAEIVAIGAAGQALQTWDLRSAGSFTLVTTTEPCAMCLGAVPWSGVDALVIGARDEDARAAGFDEGLKPDGWLDYLASLGISVTRDVLRAEAAAVLSDYAAAGGEIYNGANDA